MTRLIKHSLAWLICSVLLKSYCQITAYASVIDTADRPQIFAPDILSTPFVDWSMSFTPDGLTAYFHGHNLLDHQIIEDKRTVNGRNQPLLHFQAGLGYRNCRTS